MKFKTIAASAIVFGMVVSGSLSTVYGKTNGWVYRNGATYYYINNRMKKGWNKIRNKWYYFASNGKLIKNSIIVDGKKRFVTNKDGSKRTNRGWYKVGNDYVYVNSNSQLYTGAWLKSGNSYYAFDSKGRRINNRTWYVGNRLYAINKYGQRINGSGWVYLSGNVKVYVDRGLVAKNTWKTIYGKQYYFNSVGSTLKNTIYQGYLLDGNGAKVAKKGWNYQYSPQVRATLKYYVNNNLKVNINTWFYVGKSKYFASKKGNILTGLEYVDKEGNYFYFNSDGSLHNYKGIVTINHNILGRMQIFINSNGSFGYAIN